MQFKIRTLAKSWLIGYSRELAIAILLHFIWSDLTDRALLISATAKPSLKKAFIYHLYCWFCQVSICPNYLAGVRRTPVSNRARIEILIPNLFQWLSCSLSKAARQGLALLMAWVQVVLKQATSTLRQIYNFQPIDFKSDVGDYVPMRTNPAKFNLDRISGGAPTWWWNIQFMWLLLFLFLLFFFVSRDRVPSKPVDRFLHIVA